jgi:hypothetical protein
MSESVRPVRDDGQPLVAAPAIDGGNETASVPSIILLVIALPSLAGVSAAVFARRNGNPF